MNIRPKFYIVGERKCASSSLYRYLIHHQEILPCKIKEPQFFSKPIDQIEQEIDDYFKLYPKLEDDGDISFE